MIFSHFLADIEGVLLKNGDKKKKKKKKKKKGKNLNPKIRVLNTQNTLNNKKKKRAT